MHTNFDADIKKYIKTISHKIPNTYPHKKKKLLLNTLKSNLHLYFQSHPNASWHDALNEFGSESDILDSILSDIDSTDMNKEMQHKRIFQHILLGLCMIIAFISLLGMIYMYWWNNLKPPIIKPSHYIYDGTEVSSEEFYEYTNIYEGE